jgi:hypothetical protein
MFDAFASRLPPTAQDALLSTKGYIRKLPYISMFSWDLVDLAKKRFPAFGALTEKYYKTVAERTAEQNRGVTRLREIVSPIGEWTGKKAGYRAKLNNFLAHSAGNEQWGFDPPWLAKANFDPNSEAARLFNELPAEVQNVAVNMFEHAHNMHRSIQDALRAEIAESYQAAIDRAQTPSTKKLRELERDKALTEHDTRQMGLKDAYLPLKRFGEWAMVYKSDAFIEAEKQNNRKEIDKLKADPAHYAVWFADNEFQLRRKKRELDAAFPGLSEPFPRQRMDLQIESIPFDILQKLKENLKTTSADGKISKALLDAADRMYIEALAESSSRKSELRRLRVTGFDENMVRSFIEHGEGLANLGAALRINKDTRTHLRDLTTEAKKDGPDRAGKAWCGLRVACDKRGRQDEAVPRGKGEKRRDEGQFRGEHEAVGGAQQRLGAARLQPSQRRAAQDQNAHHRHGKTREAAQDQLRIRPAHGQKQRQERPHPEDQRRRMKRHGGQRDRGGRRHGGMARGGERQRRQRPGPKSEREPQGCVARGRAHPGKARRKHRERDRHGDGRGKPCRPGRGGQERRKGQRQHVEALHANKKRAERQGGGGGHTPDGKKCGRHRGTRNEGREERKAHGGDQPHRQGQTQGGGHARGSGGEFGRRRWRGRGLADVKGQAAADRVAIARNHAPRQQMCAIGQRGGHRDRRHSGCRSRAGSPSGNPIGHPAPGALSRHPALGLHRRGADRHCGRDPCPDR